ncbi:anti-sigma factor [Paenibacillus humicola]|uniref:anti-sigma factor n=1 Tax=Paenibacillus humicola TaxID=3110540 RepID=UPI00237BFAB0|nr:anti-sigma factor [Paenibacillus humicola]
MIGSEKTLQACRRLYREEDWIDWLLGHKSPVEFASMHEHLSVCPQCRNTAAEWRPLLQNAEMPEAYAEPSAIMPSESVRRSLRAHVATRGLLRRLHSGLFRHKGWAAGLIAAAVLLLCLTGLFRTVYVPKEQRDLYVAEHEPDAVSFLNDPRTASFRVQSLNDEVGDGYVWFNDSSREVFVLLEGVLPSDSHVLQAWAVNGSGHANLGLLRHDEVSKAHFYFKGDELAKVDNIALTVEPSGGSRMPTSPDAIVFRLQHH